MKPLTPDKLNGLIVIDKPADMSSARVVARVKKLLNAKKVGHTGTLDPFATGLLICCINDATRLAGFFLNGCKTYQAILQLGVETDTQDCTGTVTSTQDVGEYSDSEIESVFNAFTGSLFQQPPIFSALKHMGIPLYKLARSGKPFQKAPRRVTISSMNIVDIQLPTISFEVTCSAGTYIRTLSADIGNALGCGGHLKQLRRISSSGLTIREAVSLAELQQLFDSDSLEQKLIRMTDALPDMPEYIAYNGLADQIQHGVILKQNDIEFSMDAHAANHLKIVDGEKKLLAVLRYDRNSCIYHYCCVFRTQHDVL